MAILNHPLTQERLRQFVRLTLLVLLGIIGLEILFHLLVAPNLRLQKIVFAGNKPLSDSELLKTLGLREREYYFSVDERALEKQLAALAWVRQAQVRKEFPDTLRIDLQMRDAVALSLAGTAVMAMDAEGVVFAVRPQAGAWDLPIISGIPFAGVQVGMRFPPAVVPLFGHLAALRSQSPALYRLISEVEIVKNDRGSYDAVIYPLHTPVRILLGDQWNDAVLRQMFVLLDLIEKQGWTGKTREIDFRATPVVLRSRGS